MRITERKCDCSHLAMPIANYPENSTLYYPNWDDSGVLTLLYKLNVDGSVTFKDINLSIHMIDGTRYREVYDLPYLEDGWYKIRSYVFPSLKFLYTGLSMCNDFNDIEYLNYWQEHDANNMFRQNHNMTISVGEDGRFWYLVQLPKRTVRQPGHTYKWANGDILDVIDELQTRGVEEINGDDFVYGTNVQIIEEDFFTTCHLNKCFIDRAKLLLSSYSNCSLKYNAYNDNRCSNNIDNVQIQIRDYIWMTLNAIKYAIECEDYQTANKLLACISTCSGICDNSTQDCGCGSYKPLTVAKRAIYKLPEEAYTTNIQLNFFDKNEVLNLLNQKLNKLTAGTDIRISDDVISNEHRFITNSEIQNLFNNN